MLIALHNYIKNIYLVKKKTPSEDLELILDLLNVGANIGWMSIKIKMNY